MLRGRYGLVWMVLGWLAIVTAMGAIVLVLAMTMPGTLV
jgi:hypothetical protein